MTDIHSKATIQGASFLQQYILQKGMKVFGREKSSKAVSKELDQLHKQNCFAPMDVSTLTSSEKKKAQQAMMLLTEKKDGTIKGRCVYNGKPTREWLDKEDAASPTVATESIMLTATNDAKERRDIMTADVPNAFIQTKLPEGKVGEERVIMKITGVLVDSMVELASDIYRPYVVTEGGKRVLYLQVLMVLYGMLAAALLWYKKFKEDLENIDFKFNPYDACVANRSVKGGQQTVRFHVDDLMSSHKDAKVNDDFAKWLDGMYGKHGPVKVVRGKVHEYLGMRFDFSVKEQVAVDMIEYMGSIVDECSVKITTRVPSPAVDKLLSVDADSKELPKLLAEDFHTIVAKGLFACKRARPDIHMAIAFLCTRVKHPTMEDWEKLIRLLKYINWSQKDKLILGAQDLSVVKWYVDVSFAVHADYRSHTGAVMTFGHGAVQTICRKQKLNTRSSTEAELVGADDAATMILWTRLFLLAQGCEVRENILYQDNKSAILLETNGKKSSGRRTRALNIRYFFLADQVEKGNLEVEYCPTLEMIGDYMSKPLQGKLFLKLKDQIMGSEVVPPVNVKAGRSVLEDVQTDSVVRSKDSKDPRYSESWIRNPERSGSKERSN